MIEIKINYHEGKEARGIILDFFSPISSIILLHHHI